MLGTQKILEIILATTVMRLNAPPPFEQGEYMKLDVRWEPRWPCFAVGFYRGRKKNKYQMFLLIIWAIVFELTWGQA